MKHARADYAGIQDTTAARKLATLILAMPMTTESGLEAQRLAGEILGLTADAQGAAPRIPLDEPVFLIRGQDAVGAQAVRAWAALAEANGAAPDILRVARAHADLMERWPKKKIADLQQAPR